MRNVAVFFEELRGTFSNICSFLSENIYILIFFIMVINFILMKFIYERVNSEKIIDYCMWVVNINGLFLMLRFILSIQNIYLDSLWFYINLLSIGCVINLVLRRNEKFKNERKEDFNNEK